MSAWQIADEMNSSTREGERASEGAQTWSHGVKRLMSVREHMTKKKQRMDTDSETTLGGVQVVLRWTPKYSAVQSG